MANQYKVWKPPVSITEEEYDERFEKEYKMGYEYAGSFRDNVIIFKKYKDVKPVSKKVAK